MSLLTVCLKFKVNKVIWMVFGAYPSEWEASELRPEDITGGS